jgi:hypothetical protein
MPESASHLKLKKLLVLKLRKWYGASIEEFPSSGHELDVFAVTESGISIYIEIIWSPHRTQFLSDINMLQQSNADVKLVVANPELLANAEMIREFEKVVLSQRLEGKKIHADLLDGKEILRNSNFVDQQLKRLINKLVLQAKREKETASNPVALSVRQQRIPPNRLVRIRSFRLPREFGRFGNDIAAIMFFWQDSQIWVETCYVPDRRRSISINYSGGAFSVDQFLRILQLNPEIRKYEFGITGKPTCVLVVFFSHGELFGFLGSYKLLETLRGEHADQMRRIIRLLI